VLLPQRHIFLKQLLLQRADLHQGILQRLARKVLLGHVHVGSNKLDDITRRILRRMPQRMNVPDGSILPNNSEIGFIVAGIADRLLNRLRKRRSIVGMHSAQKRLEGHLRCRVQPENAEALLAEVNIPGRNASRPASRVAQSLPLAQVGFASFQGLFRLLALRYVPVDSVNFRPVTVHVDRGCYVRHIKTGSIFPFTDYFGIDPLTRFHRIAQRFRLVHRSIRDDQVIDVSPKRLLNCVTKQLRELPIRP